MSFFWISTFYATQIFFIWMYPSSWFGSFFPIVNNLTRFTQSISNNTGTERRGSYESELGRITEGMFRPNECR